MSNNNITWASNESDNYALEEALLIKEARLAGCEVIGGIDMLIEQARQQFLWWTGQEPSVDLIAKAVKKRLDIQ